MSTHLAYCPEHCRRWYEHSPACIQRMREVSADKVNLNAPCTCHDPRVSLHVATYCTCGAIETID